MDLFTPWLVLAVLFYTLRQLEVWLHQHIFKVGWLVTKQYQTTTILYYAFFLPGIILNQFIFWLVAGFLNVAAERSIAWPQKQEIGELKLDFIRLSKNVGPLRFAVISTAPLLVGLFAVWQIANNVLNVPIFLAELNVGGFLGNLSAALAHFTNAPDFWIWVYIAFAISNTMMPNFANLRGWRIVLGIFGALIAALYILGAGDQVVMNNLRGPVTDALNSLSSVFAIIIGLDVFMVLVLGTMEAIIERLTGDSATFENGKMVTLRRSELLARRQQALATRPQLRSQRAAPAPSGPPSVYKLNFPIPGAPGKEAISVSPQVVISQEPKPVLTPQPDSRTGPAVISGTVTEKLPPPSSPQTSPIPSNPAAPMSKPAALGTGSSPSPSPFNKPAAPSPATDNTPAPSTSPFGKPAAPSTGNSSPPATSPFNKPAAPTTGNAPTPSTAPFGKPAAPSTGGSPSTSPFNKPATPLGGSSSPTSSAPPSTGNPSAHSPFNKPATPIGSTPVAANPMSSTMSSPVRPAPKPVSPFATDDDLDDEDEIDDVEDDNDEDEDDEVSYEDFEDPA